MDGAISAKNILEQFWLRFSLKDVWVCVCVREREEREIEIVGWISVREGELGGVNNSSYVLVGIVL